MMITLKQALDSGKLEQFIAEHEGETGDGDARPARADRTRMTPQTRMVVGAYAMLIVLAVVIVVVT